MDEEQDIVRKLYQTGIDTESSFKKPEEVIIESKKRIFNKTAKPIRSNSSVSDIYRRAKAKLPKLQSRTRINKDESIKIQITTADKQRETDTSELKIEKKIEKKKIRGKDEKRDAPPPMPLEIYFNQDFQESSFISIANRPLPPLPK